MTGPPVCSKEMGGRTSWFRERRGWALSHVMEALRTRSQATTSRGQTPLWACLLLLHILMKLRKVKVGWSAQFI